MEVRLFRWWEDEVTAIKAPAAADVEEEEEEADVDEEEEEAAAGKGRTPKKRSLSDLIAEVPAMDAVAVPKAAGEGAVDVSEPLCTMLRRSKEMRRMRRLEDAAVDVPESSAAAERRAAEGNFAGKKSLDKPNLGDGLDTIDASEEHEDGRHLSTEREKIPNLKRSSGRVNYSLRKKADRMRYIGSRKAIKVGKERDNKKIHFRSILKKYTKRTSVKMVKEKHVNSKGPEVIELCRKSIKRVKFSEANDALGSKKQCSKRPQLESICKLLSDAMTSSSSSSIEMSSEEEPIIAESGSSPMPGKATAMAKEAFENTNQDNQSELGSNGLSTALFDLNESLPEPADLNSPCVPNPEESNLQHTQGQEQQQPATALGNRTKSPCTLPNQTNEDSIQLQNWCSMTMHHGVSQLSTGGEPSSVQFQGCNLSHSEKQIFHSEMNMQQESRPSAVQTLRLMGHDLTVSNTRVDYLSEAAQKHTNPTEDNLTTKVVLELPRQGPPFLSLQTQSTPNGSASFASTRTHVSANSASTDQAHFRYRPPHNVSHPLPAANVFSGNPSGYENSWRDFTNLQSLGNVLSACPPLSNHGSAALLQNSPPPRHCYSDHSTKTDSPSAPFSPTNIVHVTPSSDYRANLPASYGFYSPSLSIHPHNPASFTWSQPDRIVQGAPESRASAALPSRNAGTGTARSDPDNFTSSSRFGLRSGPVKLSPGAKHILIPSENTEDDNSAPMYSCVSFGRNNGNVSVPHQNKGAGSRRF
ncbi:hypothetical protein HU200_055898 [Digitaria exilis]|uniref:Uncharacterized protein n=1 Tax=Digitaria exilis TaxID=1010633 RepID=A0A835E611_9POAL|nr:hypothetical protein HU200_055898 [Digitaria exilis]